MAISEFFNRQKEGVREFFDASLTLQRNLREQFVKLINSIQINLTSIESYQFSQQEHELLLAILCFKELERRQIKQTKDQGSYEDYLASLLHMPVLEKAYVQAKQRLEAEEAAYNNPPNNRFTRAAIFNLAETFFYSYSRHLLRDGLNTPDFLNLEPRIHKIVKDWVERSAYIRE